MCVLNKIFSCFDTSTSSVDKNRSFRQELYERMKTGVQQNSKINEFLLCAIQHLLFIYFVKQDKTWFNVWKYLGVYEHMKTGVQ